MSLCERQRPKYSLNRTTLLSAFHSKSRASAATSSAQPQDKV